MTTLQTLAHHSAAVDAIRTARKQQRLSQSDLASAVGMGRYFIREFERGNVLPTPEMLARLAAAVNVGIDFDKLIVQMDGQQ